MKKVINKIANIILGYGEHAYEVQNKRIKRHVTGDTGYLPTSKVNNEFSSVTNVYPFNCEIRIGSYLEIRN